MITAERYHDISIGHMVHNHESKCLSPHGHNYRFHFKIKGELDEIGRVLDFGVIKSKLCMWLEENWDHKFIAFDQDPRGEKMKEIFQEGMILLVPFNPTAENLARHMVEVIAPIQLKGTGTELLECRIEETRKCSATYYQPSK